MGVSNGDSCPERCDSPDYRRFRWFVHSVSKNAAFMTCFTYWGVAMDNVEDITPGLPIICADELIFGYTEGVEQDYLITAPLTDGQRHFIPLNVIDHVDDGVYLSLTSDELQQIL